MYTMTKEYSMHRYGTVYISIRKTMNIILLYIVHIIRVNNIVWIFSGCSKLDGFIASFMCTIPIGTRGDPIEYSRSIRLDDICIESLLF
jgi:hypothetical protein